MSIKSIRQALEVQLATLSPSMPIVHENEAYTPTLGTAFLDTYILPAETENPTVAGAIGQELALEQGIFQVVVVVPVNEGPGNAATKAEAIRALFRRGLSLTVGSVQVKIGSTPSVASALVDSDWYRVPVSVPYFAHVEA